MRHPLRSFTLATALLAGAGACADSTGGGGGGTPPGDLNFLRLTDTAPPLCADSTGGWVKRDPAGQSIEFALVFPESGIPAASDFAVQRTSGTTPACSIANSLPVRPIPDWTSSATNSMPC